MTEYEPKVSMDNGCARAKIVGYEGNCLGCNLDSCFEDSGVSVKAVQTQRNVLDLRSNGMSVVNIAKELKVSKKTVGKYL